MCPHRSRFEIISPPIQAPSQKITCVVCSRSPLLASTRIFSSAFLSYSPPVRTVATFFFFRSTLQHRCIKSRFPTCMHLPIRQERSPVFQGVFIPKKYTHTGFYIRQPSPKLNSPPPPIRNLPALGLKVKRFSRF